MQFVQKYLLDWYLNKIKIKIVCNAFCLKKDLIEVRINVFRHIVEKKNNRGCLILIRIKIVENIVLLNKRYLNQVRIKIALNVICSKILTSNKTYS